MDIVKFDTNTNILTEKYAPSDIKNIIGAEKQVRDLTEWLKKYNDNANINLQKQNNKKTGKKTRRRKPKVDGQLDGQNETNDNEDLGLGLGLGLGTENEEVEVNDKKIKKKDPNISCCAVITGDHGTGKTTLVRAVLNSMNYQIKSVNFAKIGNVKCIDDFIENLLNGDDIYETINNKKKIKKAIIVDEIQSVWTPAEKNIICGLLKLNSEIWACPVIFIGSNKHKKIISLVKKECYHIPMYPPSIINMMKLLERIALGEKMKFESEDVVNIIINHSQNDYKRLIVILGELIRLHGGKVIKVSSLNEFMKCTEEKDMDRSIYENTNKLFTQYNGINPALKIFDNEKSNMPLMVHQNHFLALNGYIKDRSKLIDIAADITENIAHGDIIDNYIYSDQNWSLQETHGFYTCAHTSYKINNSVDTKRLLHDTKNPYYRPKFLSQYPKDLNRTSTRCINSKNVKMASENIKNIMSANAMSIDDYVMTVKLIKNLMRDNRIEECKDILKEYELSAQGIMYILKVDKINGTRKDVSKTTEKKVKEIATEPAKAAVITYK
jgi:hypothetical protein